MFCGPLQVLFNYGSYHYPFGPQQKLQMMMDIMDMDLVFHKKKPRVFPGACLNIILQYSTTPVNTPLGLTLYDDDVLCCSFFPDSGGKSTINNQNTAVFFDFFTSPLENPGHLQ